MQLRRFCGNMDLHVEHIRISSDSPSERQRGFPGIRSGITLTVKTHQTEPDGLGLLIAMQSEPFKYFKKLLCDRVHRARNLSHDERPVDAYGCKL